jgi:hypothetical protein
MGVGHVALALGASRATPRLNVGWLVFAALLSDFLLGVFAWFGLEHATVPADLATRHYLLFTFPYSYGLLPLLLWAAILGFLVSRTFEIEAKKIWLVVGLVVLSHFLLDGLVHVAGLPLAGENSPKFGLGLWNHMPQELLLETGMAVEGVALYWGLGGSALGRYGMAGFVLVVTGLGWTQLGMTEVPSAKALSVMWIILPVLFAAIAYGLDRQRVQIAGAST